MEREKVRARGGGEPDRLSELPDCLLHTIMSFLKARQAVQTCVLARRWRHLWRSAPCLDVDFDEFRAETVATDRDGNTVLGGDSSDSDSSSSDDNSSDDDDESSDDDGDVVNNKKWERFEDFTMNLMLRCNIAQLESFRLHIGHTAPSFGDNQAAGWLRCAMKYFTPDHAPHRLWLLKRMHLCNLHLNGRFLKVVNSVCHSLEEMKLKKCICGIRSITSDSLKTLILKRCKWRKLSEIASPTLKTLVIDGGSNPHRYMLVILAPSVAYLHLATMLPTFVVVFH